MNLLQGLRIAIANVFVVTKVDQVVSIDDANDSPLPQWNEVGHLVVLRHVLYLLLELTSYGADPID